MTINIYKNSQYQPKSEDGVHHFQNKGVVNREEDTRMQISKKGVDSLP